MPITNVKSSSISNEALQLQQQSPTEKSSTPWDASRSSLVSYKTLHQGGETTDGLLSWFTWARDGISSSASSLWNWMMSFVSSDKPEAKKKDSDDTFLSGGRSYGGGSVKSKPVDVSHRRNLHPDSHAKSHSAQPRPRDVSRQDEQTRVLQQQLELATRANEQLRKALAEKPKVPVDVQQQLEELTRVNGELREAIHRATTEVRPSDSRESQALARLQQQLDEAALANEQLRKALAEKPKVPVDVQQRLEELTRVNGELRDAARLAQTQAHDKGEEHTQALARLQQQLDEAALANEQLRKALAEKPKPSEEVEQQLRELSEQNAKLQLEMGQLRDAHEQEAIRIRAEDGKRKALREQEISDQDRLMKENVRRLVAEQTAEVRKEMEALQKQLQEVAAERDEARLKAAVDQAPAHRGGRGGHNQRGGRGGHQVKGGRGRGNGDE